MWTGSLGSYHLALAKLGQLGFARVEGHFVSGQPALVAEYDGTVDDRRGLDVDVGVSREGIVLHFGLELAALGSGLGGEVSVHGQLETLQALILNLESTGQLVVGRPFLGGGDSVILALVFGLERTVHLGRFEGGLTGRVEFQAGCGFGLDVELDQAEMVALAEDIAARFAQITECRRSHFS